jgi:hypothetical protein
MKRLPRVRHKLQPDQEKRPMTPTSLRLLVLAVPVLALSVAGCGSSGGAAKATPAAAKSTGPAAVKLAPAALVKQVTLRNSDFKGGLKLKLERGGDKVAGQVTLDNCGDSFSTEAHRVARRQLELVSAKGQDSGIGNEAVVYDSPKQAAKALKQFRKSVVGCRKHVFHKSKAAGVPDLKYEVNTLAKASGLPVKDNAVVTQRIAAKGFNKPLFAVVILQRQGSALSAVFLQSVTKPTDAEVANLHTLAAITGKRLAAH